MGALQPMIDLFLQHPTIPLFLLLLIPRNTRNLALVLLGLGLWTGWDHYVIYGIFILLYGLIFISYDAYRTHEEKITVKQTQGEPGPMGPQGPRGNAGKSAYQAAKEKGYQGTEEEFNTALYVIGTLYSSNRSV